ncbi:hypothetical protein LVY72_03045 [Arthrobacter sp. I2-34]|uniref:CAAX protease self-immunity n=1 Tax=Arthrobacter hankyongi TaxID=2904801 RepID=A0ABS9L2L3_9MICC|nr:hypothetical protein [Arthrobacter hankyongi]MCG2620888.1 hypothetical protein [Arthrobacter hankyongi]
MSTQGTLLAPSAAPTSTGLRVAGLLGLRLTLFAAFQALIAAILAAGGSAEPWADSAAWWPLAATAANLVNLAVLARFCHANGIRLRDFYRFRRTGWRKDLGLAVLTTAAAAPLAALPNLGLATALLGSPQAALEMFTRPLPLWAAIAAVVLFPVTTALAELPTYYGYVRPRLEALTGSAAVAVGLAALVHSLQHVALPLIFDGGFMTWRALMFLPFALLLAVVLRRRPALLPYLLVVHFLLDFQAAVMVLQVSL